MAVTYGFYDSEPDKERKYSALQMSSIFDGIISDGIILNYEQSLQLKESNPKGMSIVVQPGRAWFKHTWTYNDSDLTIAVPQADTSNDRIDIIVLEVDSDSATNAIKLVQGTADGSGIGPQLADNQLFLGGVKVSKNATTIGTSDITYFVPRPDASGSSNKNYTVTYSVSPVSNGDNLNAITVNYSSTMSMIVNDTEKAITDAKAGNVLDGSVTEEKLAESVRNKINDSNVIDSMPRIFVDNIAATNIGTLPTGYRNGARSQIRSEISSALRSYMKHDPTASINVILVPTIESGNTDNVYVNARFTKFDSDYSWMEYQVANCGCTHSITFVDSIICYIIVTPGKIYDPYS